MLTNQNITVQGANTVAVGRAPAASGEVVRLFDLEAALAGYIPAGSSILLAEIQDFTLNAPVELLGNSVLADTGGFYWEGGPGILSGIVRLKPGGGLAQDSGGIFIQDSGIMMVGDSISHLQISDWAAAFITQLESDLVNTSTIAWLDGVTQVSGVVLLSATGGLQINGDGIGANFGTGHLQIASGDHTHSQLHDIFQFQDSSSITGTLADQTLQLECALTPGGGLAIGPSGLELIFGTTAGTAMEGNAGNLGLLHNPLTVIGTPTWTPLLDYADQILSGVTRFDLNPPAGYAPLAITAGGLSLQLGTGANQPAAGNHTHLDATETNDGFMSTQDKIFLDSLHGQVKPATTIEAFLSGHGSAVTTGVKDYFVMPFSGIITGWDIVADASGLMICDVTKSAYSSFPPSASIAGTERPGLSGVQINQNTNVSTWSGACNPNDVLAFSCLFTNGTIKWVRLQLRVQPV